MTTDRDRVEAALDAWFGEGDWRSRNVRYRELMSQALAAADTFVSPAEDAADSVRRFARAILHGDEDHRAWLIEAAEAFIAGKQMPEPRGGGMPTSPELDAEKERD